MLKFGFEERGIFTSFHFYRKCSMDISGEGLLHVYKQTSSLIGSKTNHRTNMFCLVNPNLAMSQTLSAFTYFKAYFNLLIF